MEHKFKTLKKVKGNIEEHENQLSIQVNEVEAIEDNKLILAAENNNKFSLFEE